MKNPFLFIASFCFLFAVTLPLAAQDDFGFGDIDTEESGSPGFKVSGRLVAGSAFFVDEIDSLASTSDFESGNLISGQLEFSATGSNADAVIRLDMDADADEILSIDEAYIRAFFGKLDIETGLRKLSWGKADSMGPLDVINPLDYSDLSVTETMERKFARPMIHLSYSTGTFSRFEAVFVPSFKADEIALEGAWMPSQVSLLKTVFMMDTQTVQALLPDTTALEYAQAGLRYTTTLGSQDVGFQYYYGNLSTPSIVGNSPSTLGVEYNRYHQFGADWAGVVATLNSRIELALNLTEDTDGSDGTKRNPFVAWSAGFDRDVVADINLNFQIAGSVRLMDDEIGNAGYDCEADTDVTATRMTVQVSRKFLKDEIELKLAGMWGIEEKDYLAMPSFVWTKGDIEVELAGGFFGGDEEGSLGQYDANDYAKLFMTCKL